MNEENPKAEQTNESTQFTAGQTLANARQAKGISLEDLATQLKVPLKVLEAIEADELPEHLPVTFVRGYIRSYAKKVGIEESAVLTHIETTAASKPDVKDMQSFSRRSRRIKIERRLVLIGWLFASILGLALVIWWFQTTGMQMLAPLAETSSDSTPVEMSVPTKIEGEPQDGMTYTDLPPVGENSESIDNVEIKQSAEDDKVQDNSVNDVNSDESFVDQPKAVVPAQTYKESTLKQKSDEPDRNVATVEQTVQSPMVLSEAQKKLMAESGEASTEDFMRVEFKFENDCWVEVYNAFDERIAVGNKPAGYLMTLNDQGPFRVLLGNPAGVSVWVNGEEFDMSVHPTNRVARFEIDTVQ